MRIRVYLAQEAGNTLVDSILRSLSSHRGSMVPAVSVAGQTVHWSEKFGLPVIRHQSPSPDDGCELLRRLTESGLPPSVVKIRDYLPVPVMYTGPQEGVYGDDLAAGRVSGLFAHDVPIAQLQLRGAGPLPCVQLYLAMRTGMAVRMGDWTEQWWRHDLSAMRWT